MPENNSNNATTPPPTTTPSQPPATNTTVTPESSEANKFALTELGFGKPAEGATPPVETPKVEVVPPVEVPKIDAPPPAEVKPPEVKAPEVKAPEVKATEYEISISDKSPLSDKDLDEAVELAVKYKWTKEQADNYISKKEEAFNRGVQTLTDKANDIIKKEHETFMADPLFKGEEGKKSLAKINSVIAKYGDQDLAKYLSGAGGNNLPLARMLVKLGDLMQPEGNIGGQGSIHGTVQPNTKEAALANLYPSFFEEDKK